MLAPMTEKEKLTHRNWVRPVPWWSPAAAAFGPMAMMLPVLVGFQLPYWAGFTLMLVGVVGVTLTITHLHKRVYQLEKIVLDNVFEDIAREKKARKTGNRRERKCDA